MAEMSLQVCCFSCPVTGRGPERKTAAAKDLVPSNAGQGCVVGQSRVNHGTGRTEMAGKTALMYFICVFSTLPGVQLYYTQAFIDNTVSLDRFTGPFMTVQ